MNDFSNIHCGILKIITSTSFSTFLFVCKIPLCAHSTQASWLFQGTGEAKQHQLEHTHSSWGQWNSLLYEQRWKQIYGLRTCEKSYADFF